MNGYRINEQYQNPLVSVYKRTTRINDARFSTGDVRMQLIVNILMLKPRQA